MEDTLVTGIQAIQAILAPALGISATALLMLSLTNRYSMIINRVRLLNDERRRFVTKITAKPELEYHEQMRYASVQRQIQKLFERCKDLRNAILFMLAAIISFVLSSITIAVNIFISSSFLRTLPVIIFSLGMLLVLVAVLFSARDIYKAFRVTQIEVNADE